MTTPGLELFDQALKEEQAKAAAISDLSERRKAWLAIVRGHCETLYARRQGEVARRGHWLTPDGKTSPQPYVSADDARAFFEAMTPAPAKEISRNFLGATFLSSRWERIRGLSVNSATDGSHGNELPCWRLRR